MSADFSKGTIEGFGTIVGFCNPLLDIISTVDHNFLAKYNLIPDSVHLDAVMHTKIYEEIEKRSNRKVPGGSGQNTLRMISWLLNTDGEANVKFVGCVGDDLDATILKEAASKIGLDTMFQVVEGGKTGSCIALVTGQERTLITDLGAANMFNADFLDRPDVWKSIENANIIYVTGFFVAVCPEAAMRLAKHVSKKNNALFCLNLSAEFICDLQIDNLQAILPYVNVLFCNFKELCAFCSKFLVNYNEIVEERVDVTERMVELSKAVSKSPSIACTRVVVVTSGAGPVVVSFADDTHIFHPDTVENIVDSNGAGDAFVAGFLAQAYRDICTDGKIQGKRAVRVAIKAASVILQQTGFTLPSEKELVEEIWAAVDENK